MVASRGGETMKKGHAHYLSWAEIDYVPSVDLTPDALLPFLESGNRVLDIGCGKGVASLFLARHGIDVLAMDLNSAALKVGEDAALREGLQGRIRFIQDDIVKVCPTGPFDAIIMCRLLTCLPDRVDWSAALANSNAALKAGGVLFVQDFCRELDSLTY